MMGLVELRRTNIGFYNVRSGRPCHNVWQARGRIEARICVIAVPAAIMVFDRIGDFLEGIEPLETVVAEGTRQLATHFGVLSHGDYEMRLAVWRSLSHHGGSRYRVLDNLADDSLSHQPTG
jgi:hypothetical protein